MVEVIGVFIPITALLMTAVILWAFFYYRYRARSDLQATVRQAIESGQPLSPELMAQLGTPEDPRRADLRRGVIAVFIGLAFAAFGFIFGEEDAIRPMLAVGTFPFLLGVAYLALWRFADRAE